MKRSPGSLPAAAQVEGDPELVRRGLQVLGLLLPLVQREVGPWEALGGRAFNVDGVLLAAGVRGHQQDGWRWYRHGAYNAEKGGRVSGWLEQGPTWLCGFGKWLTLSGPCSSLPQLITDLFFTCQILAHS